MANTKGVVAWAKEHKYLAIAAVVGLVVILYVLLHSGGSAKSSLTYQQQLNLQKLQDSTSLQALNIQASAAKQPYLSQQAIAGTAAGASEQEANTQAGVQNNSIAAQLQATLASIAGQFNITQSNNQTSLAINTENNQTQQQANTQGYNLGLANLSDTLKQALASIAGNITISQGQTSAQEAEQAAAIKEQQQQDAYSEQDYLLNLQGPGKLQWGDIQNLLGENGLFHSWIEDFQNF